MNNGTDQSSIEAARARRGRYFLAGWTLFAAAAVWWLVRRANTVNIDPNWFIAGDTLANASLAERVSNWFKLADLNFHGVYPLVLLAPYVAWMGARFHLEQGKWRINLPAHLAACALFMVAAHLLAERIAWDQQVMIQVVAETRSSQDGPHGRVTTTGRTNVVTIITNAASGQWPALWAGRPLDQPPVPDPHGTVAGAAMGAVVADQTSRHNFLFWQQWNSHMLSDLFNLFAYASLVGVMHAVHFYHRSKERDARAALLEAQLTKARLHALQAQLHPHFLFNALNAISTLLRRDTRAAQDALASFSELLRLALGHSSQPEVSLRDDLEFLRRYVEIQQTRLGDRFRFEEAIDPDALDCLVPALLLQPLVENAIRHGIEPSPDPGFVRVEVHATGDRLLVTVEDNGAGLSTNENQSGAGMGIGLPNLRSRLESLYGGKQRVEVAARTGGGVCVRIEFPRRQAQPAETAAAITA